MIYFGYSDVMVDVTPAVDETKAVRTGISRVFGYVHVILINIKNVLMIKIFHRETNVYVHNEITL